MTDAYLIWNPINLFYSENFVQAALVLNVLLTLLSVFQNVRNGKLLQIITSPRGNKSIIETKGDIPPFIDETLANSSKKKMADIDLPKIERAIKMIKDGYSQEEIIDVVDLEAAYTSILHQNYKVSES
jgi:hypothetical protein